MSKNQVMGRMQIQMSCLPLKRESLEPMLAIIKQSILFTVILKTRNKKVIMKVPRMQFSAFDVK